MINDGVLTTIETIQELLPCEHLADGKGDQLILAHQAMMHCRMMVGADHNQVRNVVAGTTVDVVNIVSRLPVAKWAFPIWESSLDDLPEGPIRNLFPVAGSSGLEPTIVRAKPSSWSVW